MKKAVFAMLMCLGWASSQAQESQTTFNFLRLPVSAHAAALGGENITIVEDDPSLLFHNPSLLTNVSDKSINLNFMSYMEGAKTASASFAKAINDKASWAVGAQYMDFGSMKEVTADNVITGSFSAKDVLVSGSFAYVLSKHLAGGITAKFISSSIAGYNALAVGVDLGLNYYDEGRGLSVSAVARNLGGQVKAYEDDFERMPLDLQVGVSKKLVGAPLRFSATLVKLNDWEDGLKKHIVVGADILLSEAIYIAGGYNFGRADDMTIEDAENSSSHGAGLSLGAGLQLERFKLQMAYAKYHVSSTSLLFSLTYSL
jgi:hypothetical protein